MAPEPVPEKLLSLRENSGSNEDSSSPNTLGNPSNGSGSDECVSSDSKKQPSKRFKHDIPHLGFNPMGMGLFEPKEPIVKYELLMRQQPLQARMSGYAISDRRPLDPTPIVQLMCRDQKGNPIPSRFQDASFLVAHASLWNHNLTQQLNAVSAPAPSKNGKVYAKSPAPDVPPTSEHNQILLGSLISPCHMLTDIDGEKGMFFLFTDISVRISGSYRLKISLYDLKNTFTNSSPIATITTNTFVVYSPKTFPGMSDSSQLSKLISKQGIRIHIRSDCRKDNMDYDE